MPDLNTSIREQRQYLNDLGYDTLPLAQNTKVPAVRGWTHLAPEELWVNPGTNPNIGIRCSGKNNLVVIDCDEKNYEGTFGNVCRILEENGYSIKDFPIVQTASGIGKHVYASMPYSGVKDIYEIIDSVGRGEVRCGSGAQVVAPPSIVEGQEYKLLQGDLENLPVISQDIVFGKIANEHDMTPQIENIPVEDAELPDLARRLFNGYGLDQYKNDRSCAEEGIILSMVNAGFSEEEIYLQFTLHTFPGHFTELFSHNPIYAKNYFTRSYNNAVQHRENTFARIETEVNKLGTWAFQRKWAGRGGLSDKYVFMAHLSLILKCHKQEYGASVRELAEISGLGDTTVFNANNRLIKQQIIIPYKQSNNCESTIYSIHEDSLTQCETLLPDALIVQECFTYQKHDAFRYKGLGKLGLEIILHLRKKPHTVPELASFVSQSEDTITRSLNRMLNLRDLVHGNESVPLVTIKEGVWQLAPEHDLNRVAQVCNTLGMRVRQRESHKNERNYTRGALNYQKKIYARRPVTLR